MSENTKMRLMGFACAAALICIIMLIANSKNVMARGYIVTTKETTTLSQEENTEETTAKTSKKSSETTTKKSSSKSKDEETTEAETDEADETAEETTEEETETTTEAKAVDENGNPLTGNKLKAWNVIANTHKDKWRDPVDISPVDTTVYSDSVYTKSKRSFSFSNGDEFELYRYNFNISDFTEITTVTETTTEASTTADETAEQTTAELTTETTTEAEPQIVYNRVSDSITIPGSKIEIRYISPETGEWYMSGNEANTAKQTLFIDTDLYHMVISVPAVYTNVHTNNTLVYVPDLEEMVTIEKISDGYKLNYSFPINTETFGEIWMLKSETELINWISGDSFTAMAQDLGLEKRFSIDGYYYPTPSTYDPYSPTTLYRHPSNYTGTSFVKSTIQSNMTTELGYVFVWTCMQNQNDKGYWATGPKSEWLSTDFNIGAGFYDTRFNTDFASSLLVAYKKYNNIDFLSSACFYAEYFLEHAENKSYETTNGGILVQDYGYDYDHKDTHVSLNHQLAELNFLYSLYSITKEQRYRDTADKMLQAIDDTRDQWVLASNDLNYALYYMGDTNTMKDYPYLTYNDLFTTKQLIKELFGKTNSTIEYLMASKKMWMDANNITGYYTE